jgi:hypothetical protein
LLLHHVMMHPSARGPTLLLPMPLCQFPPPNASGGAQAAAMPQKTTSLGRARRQEYDRSSYMHFGIVTVFVR